MDCVNGESFGFDTIRLKENNLRIKADDTSTSASFPKNDWQITFNETANGGLEKFSIDDITGGRTPFTIEAGAPSNSLYVDDGGRIGLGTNTPVVELHVKDGDSPTLRLEQDGSSGFTPQTWDLAGNETNFFVRDVTNGSKLPLKIKPNAPTSSIFVEGSTGNIGLGTESPDAALEVHNDETVGLKVVNTGGGVNLQMDAGDTGKFWNITAQADVASTTGSFVINNNDGMGSTEFTLTEGGDLTIEGELTTATTTYPDYVFDEGTYDLMPLHELRTFIESENHLPNVPTEADVQANNGMVNMSEMQMLLLEKVEELTLYTLQQQETIEKLQARLDKVEAAK
jgi:hypothetical protein